MGEVNDEKPGGLQEECPPAPRRCSAGEEADFRVRFISLFMRKGELAAITGSANALLAISHWNMFNKSIFPQEGPVMPRAQHQSSA